MNDSLLMLVPIAGFIGGVFLWTRIAHLLIALAGLTPSPANRAKELAVVAKSHLRLVLSLAAGWLLVFGALVADMLHTGRTGWALLFAGLCAVPLFTVTNYLIVIRRFQRRLPAPKAQ